MSRPAVGISPELLAPNAVRRWADAEGDRVATCEVGGESYTYAELDERARTWAAAYARLDVQRDDHVATLLPNGHAAHAAWLGLGWVGAREVPLNSALLGTLLHDALLRSDASVLVVAEAFAERLVGLDPLPHLRDVVVVPAIGEPAFLDGVEPAAPGALEGPTYRDISVVLFTSGTTGPSKPVLVPWANIYQFWSWVPDDTLVEGEAVYCPLPMAHNSGRSCLNYTLATGGTFVFRERFSGTTFWPDVRAHDCVAAAIVGPMTAVLHSQPAQPDDADNPLRGVLCGPLIPQVDEFKARFGVQVATCYGMTETGAALSTGWDHGPPAGCGRPRLDYPWPEVRVVDENDEPLGPHEVGELIVRSAEPWSMNGGYHGMPEATAEAWRNGWFHTGDAFRVDDDGNYYLVDRLKDAIRRRGENISSFEVENVVRGYPGVSDCAAIGVPAELGGDEVMVIVEATNGVELSPAELHTWLDERLPKFMVPRYINVAVLPRNATTQRVKKFELRSRGVTADTWEAS